VAARDGIAGLSVSARRLRSGPRFKTVSSGGSFGSSPLRQEIGLGDADAIDRVEIRWPGCPAQVLQGLEIDRRYVVREGVASPTPLTLRSFRLGGGESPRRST
jgi:hypothetical protein